MLSYRKTYGIGMYKERRRNNTRGNIFRRGECNLHCIIYLKMSGIYFGQEQHSSNIRTVVNLSCK